MPANDYKQCKVNPAHFYLLKYGDDCPYCKEERIDFSDDETMVGNMGSSHDDIDATLIEGHEYPKKVKPVIMDEIVEDGTMVQRSEKKGTKEASNTKRIVGWLISYDYDSNGMDYRLYEGRNKFGSSTKVANSIPGDQQISDIHFTIIFRNKKFALKDEESTNGTKLNGTAIDLIDNVVKLVDKDIIVVGDTTFYFRSSV